jgi:hypothetical protein
VLDAYTAMSSGRELAAVAGMLRIGLAEGFAVACDAALDLAVLVDPVGDRALRLLPLGSQRNV